VTYKITILELLVQRGLSLDFLLGTRFQLGLQASSVNNPFIPAAFTSSHRRLLRIRGLTMFRMSELVFSHVKASHPRKVHSYPKARYQEAGSRDASLFSVSSHMGWPKGRIPSIYLKWYHMEDVDPGKRHSFRCTKKKLFYVDILL
jgi:hypothetical protein